MQTLSDRLTESVYLVMDHASPTQRGNLIRWFMEDFPLTAGQMIGMNGSKCLLGSLTSDSRSGNHLTLMDRDPDYRRFFFSFDDGHKFDLIWSAFDSHMRTHGHDETRRVVIAAIRTWQTWNVPEDAVLRDACLLPVVESIESAESELVHALG